MSCNLLIVDDSPILRAAIKKTARLAGVKDEGISEAGNGKEALEVLETHWVDLILLDLNMPVMNGEEFVEALKKSETLASIPVVVVSTESNRDRLSRLKDLGVVATLHKPFEPEDLCHLISQTLGVKL
ncbi:MAG: response regulator [Phycisphaerales bacterium]